MKELLSGDALNDLETELILRIVSNAGIQMRQDDPRSLREIVLIVNSKPNLDTLNLRTKFMVEMIIDLKNNKSLKTNTSDAMSMVVRMKKALGQMPRLDAFQVSLNELRDVNEKGRWWLVGAAWQGNNIKPNDQQVEQESSMNPSTLLGLARSQKMNTSIRQDLFVAIMGSEDYIDACRRVYGLRLKRPLLREVATVVVHCCKTGSSYNPYFAAVASNLCNESDEQPKRIKSTQLGFQFAARDFINQMLEEEEQDIDDAGIEPNHIANLGKFFGTLIAENAIDISGLFQVGISIFVLNAES